MVEQNIVIQEYESFKWTPFIFCLSQIADVNLLGQEVARLFSGELGAGEHSFAWNAISIPPGSYWCTLRTSDGVKRIALSVQR